VEIKDKLLKFSSPARMVTQRGSGASISPSLWRQFCCRRRYYTIIITLFCKSRCLNYAMRIFPHS